MEFFRNARVVRLRSCHGQYLIAKDSEETVALCNEEMRRRDSAAQVGRLRSGHGQYLIAKDNEETIALRDEETRRGDSALLEEMRHPSPRGDRNWWTVEFIINSDSTLHLKSRYGKYLTASDQPSLLGMTGCKVLQSLPSPLDSSHELEPVMEGAHVKLRTHYGTFLRANGDHPTYPDSVTHDLPHCTTILWNVEVLEREEEGSAANIDYKASEEGSVSNIDDQASEEGSATKRRHETGGGSSATKSPLKDSGPIPESDWVKYRRHFWKLKSWLLDYSGREDVLVRGKLGTTLVREVCADVREHFGTIAWISFPQKNDSESIREEILLQLIFERAAFPENFETNSWMSMDPKFSLQQNGRCLIVVDNLEDDRTWEKIKEVSQIVNTCRVIFIARRSSSSGIIEKHGRIFKTCELKDLTCEPRAYLKDFGGKDWTEICQLIVRKCERLPSPIVFVLCNQEKRRPHRSSEIIKDEWEARNPSVNLFQELLVIQQVLKKDLHKDEGHELDHIQAILEILRKNDRRLCFLYLGIFPENTPISYNRICRLWSAEGLLPKLVRAEPFSPDDRLRKCIRLVERSDGECSTFQVDKSVRDIIVSLSNLSDLVTLTSEHGTNWLFVQGAIEALNEDKSPQLSSIFTLDVSSNEDKITTSEALPLEAFETPSFPSQLKVLDLSGAPFQIIPDGVFELTDLRYFCLRNTPTKIIPGSIGKLTHLEFLDAKHSLVTELPKEFEGLERIRQILIYHHEKDPLMNSYNLIGFQALCSIGGFEYLEKLCFVEADETILKDLVNLTRLRRLGINKLREEHGKLLCSALEKLQKLMSLNVHALDEDEILDLHYQTSPPKSLKHLYLHGRLKKLPDWISSLNDLTRIMLRWSHLDVDPLATLGNLPNLVELELCRAYDEEQLDFKKGKFEKLKILLLEELEGLRSMSLEKGTLPRLESLTISGCQWLERIPSGIEKTPALQKLTFFDMSNEFYDKVRVDHEKDHYKIFEHIQEVYFTRWRAGHWETHQGESADEAHCSQQVDSTDERVDSTDEKMEIRLEELYQDLSM